jgi:hypothetical protein
MADCGADRYILSTVEVPITVAVQSKTWIIFTLSNTGVVGSNPTQGMDVVYIILCLCCPVQVSALQQADPII